MGEACRSQLSDEACSLRCLRCLKFPVVDGESIRGESVPIAPVFTSCDRQSQFHCLVEFPSLSFAYSPRIIPTCLPHLLTRWSPLPLIYLATALCARSAWYEELSSAP